MNTVCKQLEKLNPGYYFHCACNDMGEDFIVTNFPEVRWENIVIPEGCWKGFNTVHIMDEDAEEDICYQVMFENPESDDFCEDAEFLLWTL